MGERKQKKCGGGDNEIYDEEVEEGCVQRQKDGSGCPWRVRGATQGIRAISKKGCQPFPFRSLYELHIFWKTKK